MRYVPAARGGQRVRAALDAFDCGLEPAAAGRAGLRRAREGGEALTRRLNLNSVARSEALAARLQQKRREMAERAVSMERLHQWILAQPVKKSDAAEADAQQDQADEKAGTPHGCEVL